MSDSDHEHNEAIVLDGGDNAKIAHTIAPQALAVADQSVTEAARVLRRGNAFTQIAQDVALCHRPELAQVAHRITVELDAPNASLRHRAVLSVCKQFGFKRVETYARCPAREP